MPIFSAILALLVGVAGWNYLFYGRGARGLRDLEPSGVNRRRMMLRRINGLSMMLLAILMYVGTHGLDSHEHPRMFLACWLGAIVLLFAVVVLAAIDVRLTYKLSKKGNR